MEERQDSISRQAALDILHDFAGCIIDTPNGDYHKAYKAYRHRLEILPSAQPERKTDGDMISRQAVKDIMFNLRTSGYNNDKHFAELCLEELDALPSAQPERTKRIIGKSRDGMTMWYQCESCNEPVDEKDLFCSGCGRKFEDG